jgi:2-keto-3-deoxy-L-fuconate dehydrogenase
MSNPFTDLVAVVTGAGSGIGLAVCKELHSKGAKVFGLDIAEGSMANFATFVKCDVGSMQSVQNALSIIKTKTNVIDILINNAGIGAIGNIESATDEDWNRVLNVNVIGISRISAATLPLLRKSKNASIVNTCSIAATAGLPARAIYSASKGAVLSLTLAMAADYVKERIRVNCVLTPEQLTLLGLLDFSSKPRIPTLSEVHLKHDSPWGASCRQKKSQVQFFTLQVQNNPQLLGYP